VQLYILELEVVKITQNIGCTIMVTRLSCDVNYSMLTPVWTPRVMHGEDTNVTLESLILWLFCVVAAGVLVCNIPLSVSFAAIRRVLIVTSSLCWDQLVDVALVWLFSGWIVADQSHFVVRPDIITIRTVPLSKDAFFVVHKGITAHMSTDSHWAIAQLVCDFINEVLALSIHDVDVLLKLIGHSWFVVISAAARCCSVLVISIVFEAMISSIPCHSVSPSTGTSTAAVARASTVDRLLFRDADWVTFGSNGNVTFKSRSSSKGVA